jgi:hypothetical protein
MTNLFNVLTQSERSQLIQKLYESADPGTFSDLDLLSLAELKELASILEVAE